MCVCVCVHMCVCQWGGGWGADVCVWIREKEIRSVSDVHAHRLEVSHCDIWFIRFCVDYHHELLALGNTAGKIFIWDLTSDETSRIR